MVLLYLSSQHLKVVRIFNAFTQDMLSSIPLGFHKFLLFPVYSLIFVTSLFYFVIAVVFAQGCFFFFSLAFELKGQFIQRKNGFLFIRLVFVDYLLCTRHCVKQENGKQYKHGPLYLEMQCERHPNKNYCYKGNLTQGLLFCFGGGAFLRK